MLSILRLNIPNRHSGEAAVRLAARLRASPILRGRRPVPFADASSVANERARSFACSSDSGHPLLRLQALWKVHFRCVMNSVS